MKRLGLRNMIKCILLDVDGTLMDTKEAFFNSLNSTLKKYNIIKKTEESLFGMSVEQVLNKLEINMVSGIKEYWERTFVKECKHSAFYTGVEDMLHDLKEKGVVIYIVTSRSHCTVDSICNDSKISPYIDGCIAAEDTVFHKPHPEPIIKALEKTNSNIHETLYIGDTYQDFQAASAAGVSFGFAGWNKEAVNENYEIVFSLPTEVNSLIGG